MSPKTKLGARAIFPVYQNKVFQQKSKSSKILRYELDTSKPKVWQFFDTFYEETNHRSAEPRGRSGSSLNMFQQFFVDIFLKIVDPL